MKNPALTLGLATLAFALNLAPQAAHAGIGYSFAAKSMIAAGIVDKETTVHNLNVYRQILENIRATAASNQFYAQRRTEIVGMINDLDSRVKSQFNDIPESMRSYSATLISPAELNDVITTGKTAANQYKVEEVIAIADKALLQLNEIDKSVGEI